MDNPVEELVIAPVEDPVDASVEGPVGGPVGGLVMELDELEGLDNGEAILFEACKRGDIGLVEQIIAIGSVDIHAVDYHASWLACVNGHTHLLKLLIEHGTDIFVDDNLLLHVACRYGYIDIVILLLECGIDKKIQDQWSLRTAITYGHIDIVCLLLGCELPAFDTTDANIIDHAIRYMNNNTDILDILLYYGYYVRTSSIKRLQTLSQTLQTQSNIKQLKHAEEMCVNAKLKQLAKKVAVWRLQNSETLRVYVHNVIWGPPMPWRPCGSLAYRRCMEQYHNSLIHLQKNNEMA